MHQIVTAILLYISILGTLQDIIDIVTQHTFLKTVLAFGMGAFACKKIEKRALKLNVAHHIQLLVAYF